jgi:hypothetical protein
MKNLSKFAALAALAAAADVNILSIAAIAANNETVTIGSVVYTCKTSPATAYEFAPGANAAGSITNLVACINATTSTTKLRAVALTGAVLVLDTEARGGRTCAETLAGSGNAWLVNKTYGAGTATDSPEIPLIFSRTCTAAEDTGKLIAFALPFTPVEILVQIRTSAGAIKAWDGKLTKGAGYVLLNSDGAADIAENDVVTLLATM